MKVVGGERILLEVAADIGGIGQLGVVEGADAAGRRIDAAGCNQAQIVVKAGACAGVAAILGNEQAKIVPLVGAGGQPGAQGHGDDLPLVGAGRKDGIEHVDLAKTDIVGCTVIRDARQIIDAALRRGCTGAGQQP